MHICGVKQKLQWRHFWKRIFKYVVTFTAWRLYMWAQTTAALSWAEIHVQAAKVHTHTRAQTKSQQNNKWNPQEVIYHNI